MSKTPTFLIATVLISSIVITGPAFARGQGGGKMDFTALDSDQNGGISKAEMAANALKRAQDMDANKDGSISQEELIASVKARKGGDSEKAAKRGAKRAERMLEHADSNNDGVVSVTELSQARTKRLDRMFAKLDKDDSGEISQEELQAAKKRGKRRDKSE